MRSRKPPHKSRNKTKTRKQNKKTKKPRAKTKFGRGQSNAELQEAKQRTILTQQQRAS